MTEMLEIDVKNLNGTALNWIVAEIEGVRSNQPDNDSEADAGDKYSPSSDWAQGGPIIEREHIRLRPTITAGGYRTSKSFDAIEAQIDLPNGATNFDPSQVVTEYGPTPLIAAMRCYVVSKLGEVVNVPREVLEDLEEAGGRPSTRMTAKA